MSIFRNLIDIVESALTERAGPSRMVDHIKNGDVFFAISAFRETNDKETNIGKTRQLKDDLRSSGVSFFETRGEFMIPDGTTPEEEISFFVMNRRGDEEVPYDDFVGLGVSLMHKYDQWGLIYGDGETIYLQTNAGEVSTVGNSVTFSPSIIRDLPGFTKLQGRKYSFTDRDTYDERKQAEMGANPTDFENEKNREQRPLTYGERRRRDQD